MHVRTQCWNWSAEDSHWLCSLLQLGRTASPSWAGLKGWTTVTEQVPAKPGQQNNESPQHAPSLRAQGIVPLTHTLVLLLRFYHVDLCVSDLVHTQWEQARSRALYAAHKTMHELLLVGIRIWLWHIGYLGFSELQQEFISVLLDFTYISHKH